MKPVRLSMRAFGPFAAEQVIDFRELGERAFFLVHGPTGAGKTTVLDAICFALYGESTGDLRQADHFRSTHAGAEDETQVVLDFALGGERYRVWRKPAQERAKKRGSGTTKVSAEATLWRRTHCSSDEEEGTPLETQPSKVTERLKSLLGFEAAQFRQVVVLPQGEFRRLLVADSRDREEILERLFDVARYQRIQETLKSSADALRRRWEQGRDQRATLLEQAGAESVSEVARRVEAFAASIEAARAARDATQRADAEARRALESGRESARRLQALAAAEAKLSTHGERAAEFANERERLDAARRAEPVSPRADALRAREAEHSDAAREARSAAQAFEEASTRRGDARGAFEREQAREPEREAATNERQRLEQGVERAEALEGARTASLRAEVAARRAAEALDAVRTQLKAAREEAEGLVAAEGRAKLKAAGLEAAERGLGSARLQLDRVGRLAERSLERESAAAELERAREARANADHALAAANEADRLLREAARLGRAVMLARELSPGEPCPVCGAEHHPAPASALQSESGQALAVPDDERLRRSEAALDAAREQQRRCESAQTQLETRLERLRAEVEALTDALREPGAVGSAEETRLDLLKRHFEAELESASEAERSARAAVTELDELSKARDGLAGRTAELVEAEAARVAEHEAASGELNRCRGVVAEQESQIAEALRAPGALVAALASARESEQALERALEHARELAATTDTACSGAQARDESARKRLDEAEAALERERTALASALASAGFADERALDDARLDEGDRAALERRIREYGEAGERARGELDAARVAAEGIEAPDLAALEAADSQARAAANAAIEGLAAMEQERRDLVRLEGKLAELERGLASLDERHRVLGRLSEVANGGNPRKLTFQRFVLAAFLDEVLELASHSLLEMTNGRYALRRTSEVRDKRSQSGLDLVVSDAHTGDDRSVATLSGGESFMAALALALGLADVVQRHAGGIKLESIFIDEGFGSLDSDSLDRAVRTLLELRRGGRMVGVISHVGELRERIDTRLELHTERGGSRAEFVLG